jgi:lysophospholipase L1-like esterase
MFQGFSTTQAAANIKTMAQMAKAANVKVVLVVPYRFDSAHPASWMQPFDACAADGAYPFSLNQEPVLNAGIVAEGLPTANLETVFLTGCQSDYTVDGVHPNANGYSQMHDAIEKAIEAMQK